MPPFYLRQARMTRTAISPRLAIRILLMDTGSDMKGVLLWLGNINDVVGFRWWDEWLYCVYQLIQVFSNHFPNPI